MKTYSTSEVARLIGVHPNTVRLYERLELIPKARRLPNGYRVFTEQHIEHFRLARTAFHVEILQNGLRKAVVQTVKTAARGDYDGAISQTEDYIRRLLAEQENAREAVRVSEQILSGEAPGDARPLKRKEAAAQLGISMDTLRNWEMNGLLSVKRRENGYRVYTQRDMDKLKIIRSLRCANYSLEAILRMLSALQADPHADIAEALGSLIPQEDTVPAVCDRLMVSLETAKSNAETIRSMLRRMQRKY